MGIANYKSSLEGWPRKTRRSVGPGHAQSRGLSEIFSRDRKTRGGSGCLDERMHRALCLGPTDGIVLHYARRKVQSSTCIPVGMHTEALAPPKPTGINSTNWTWFGSWQTSVPYRSSTFLRTRDSWISRSIAFSPRTIALSPMETNIPLPPSSIFLLFATYLSRLFYMEDANISSLTMFEIIEGRGNGEEESLLKESWKKIKIP